MIKDLRAFDKICPYTGDQAKKAGLAKTLFLGCGLHNKGEM